MKKKDPRKSLLFWGRTSIISLVLIPFLYFNLKRGNLLNLIIFVALIIIGFFLIKKFLPKKDEGIKLHNTIITGYMFSGTWFFLFLIFAFGILLDYFKRGILPSINTLTIEAVLLFFSLVLFYFSNKSRNYEKLKR